MDQLKAVWAEIVKYNFWILTTIVLIACLVAFYISRSALDEKVATRILKLEGDFRVVSTLSAEVPQHPNAFTEKEMDAMIAQVSMNVKEAWRKQYERQKQILKWDRSVITNDAVHAKLDSYRPIELSLPYPLKEDPIQVTYREQYKKYCKKLFPDLAKIIGANWTAELGSASVAASSDSGGESSEPTDAAPTSQKSLVVWNQSSQDALQKSIVPWYASSSAPSTIDICYSQEDIWILQGVLQVIKATNGNAKENFQAPIKEVEWIRIGKSAGGDAGAMMPMGGMDDGSGDMSGMGTASFSVDPADNRYVDSSYKPVPSSRLRAAMSSSNKEDAPFLVAKRVPVRFRVKMDQAKIAKLLAECGNGDLMIEVKQVRINAGEGGGSIAIGGAMGFGGGGMGMVGGEDSGGSGGGDEGGGGDFGGAGTTIGASRPDPPVEIYGIVYLFNPVDFQRLGLDKDAGTSAPVTTASPVPSSAIPATAPMASSGVAATVTTPVPSNAPSPVPAPSSPPAAVTGSPVTAPPSTPTGPSS